jgi:general secretion pathway protein G
MVTQPRRTPGFTIVELLIVVVVIGILAAIVIVAYNGIQATARDNIRKSDLKNLATAIEAYYATNGNYPMSAGWCTQISHPSYTTAFQTEMAQFLNQLPLDPQYEATYQDYFYRNIGDQSYYLYAELEGEERADDGVPGCARIDNTNNEYDYRYPVF